MSPKKPTPDPVPGPDVRPTGLGGSYLIDPATGLPMAPPVAVALAPPAPEPAAEAAQSGKKEPGK